MNTQRVTQLKQQLIDNNIDGIVLMPAENMVYLSGIHSHVSERPVLLFIPADGEPAIIMPTLEAMKAEKAGVPTARIFNWGDDDGYAGAFAQAAQVLDLDNKTYAVESLQMRVLELGLLKFHAPNLTIVHADPIMTALRMSKGADEVAAMEAAIALSEKSLNSLIPQIKVGMTEKAIATLLSQILADNGSERNAFGPIVSAGPNSASPHAVPTNRPIQSGDLLVIDFGGVKHEYPADITRTFGIGELDAELVTIHETVQLALEAGKKAAILGAMGRDIDRAARRVIVDAGYGDYFIHRTGHGLGLEIHEPPYVMEGNNRPIPTGAVFTVEPGIYLPNRGGVRIEDDLLMTANGQRCLTTLPRELMIIG